MLMPWSGICSVEVNLCISTPYWRLLDDSFWYLWFNTAVIWALIALCSDDIYLDPIIYWLYWIPSMKYSVNTSNTDVESFYPNSCTLISFCYSMWLAWEIATQVTTVAVRFAGKPPWQIYIIKHWRLEHFKFLIMCLKALMNFRPFHTALTGTINNPCYT